MASVRAVIGVWSIAAVQAQHFVLPTIDQFQQQQQFQPQQFQQPAPDFSQYGFSQFTAAASNTPGPAPLQPSAGGVTEPVTDSSKCDLAAGAESECCQVEQADNPLAQGSKLNVGGIYCAQAADTNWWNVVVIEQHCDGSYHVVVQDEVKTVWPKIQRALMLDVSCQAFYNEAAVAMGAPPVHQVPEARATPQPEAAAPVVDVAPEQEPVVIGEQPAAEEGQIPVKEKGTKGTVPWKVLTGAVAAAAVPLVYQLSQ